MRRAGIFITRLSLLLSGAAVLMWVRSEYATDVVELPPQFARNFSYTAMEGWRTHRLAQSADGRLTFVKYSVLEVAAKNDTPFYRIVQEPLVPGQYEFGGHRPYRPLVPTWHIPGVASHWIDLRFGRQRYLSISWPAIVLAAASPLVLLPVLLAGWDRWRRHRGRAFPVLPVQPIAALSTSEPR